MKKVLIAIMVIGFLVSAYMVYQIERIDRASRTVEIAVDFDDVLTIAKENALDPAELFATLGEAGASAVGLREAPMYRYRREGTVIVSTGSDILAQWTATGTAHPDLTELLESGEIKPFPTYVLTSDGELARKIEHKAKIKFQRPVRFFELENLYVIEVNEDFNRVNGLRLGVDANDVALIRSAGLRIVPRPDNVYMRSVEAAKETMQEFLTLPRNFLSAVVFEGTETTGNTRYLRQVADELNRVNIPFGIIEFMERQGGTQSLLAQTNFNVVLVHPSNNDIDAYANSVRERRVRMVYLRLQTSDPDILRKGPSMLKELTEKLNRYGYTTGPAVAFPDLRFPRIVRLVPVLGLAAACTLLFSSILGGSNLLLGILLLLSFLGLGGLIPIFTGNRIFQLFSILAAGVFASLAVVSQQLNRLPETPLDNRAAVKYALLTMLRTTLVVVFGGMYITALTSTRYFLTGAALFHGVKLVHTLPIILVAFLALWRIYYGHVEKWSVSAVWQMLKKTLYSPIVVLWLILIGLIGVFIYFYIGRTGHTAGVPVSALELQVRRILGEVLLVRPRFKEFLIGHPLSLLALVCLAKGSRSALTTTLTVIGAIAPVSIANTYMHFTTPTPFTDATIRTFNGLWLGMVFGLILTGIVLFFIPRIKRWVGEL